MRGHVDDVCAAQKETRGGSRDTEVKLLTAIPAGPVGGRRRDQRDAGRELPEDAAEPPAGGLGHLVLGHGQRSPRQPSYGVISSSAGLTCSMKSSSCRTTLSAGCCAQW